MTSSVTVVKSWLTCAMFDDVACRKGRGPAGRDASVHHCCPCYDQHECRQVTDRTCFCQTTTTKAKLDPASVSKQQAVKWVREEEANAKNDIEAGQG